MIFAIIGLALLLFFAGFLVWSLPHGGRPTLYLLVVGFVGLLLTVADPFFALPIIKWIANLPWVGI